MPVPLGAFAPMFTAPSKTRPDFAFGSLGGSYALLLFLPGQPQADARAEALVRAHRHRFDDREMPLFRVIRNRAAFEQARDAPGQRHFHDPTGEIARLYGVELPDGRTAGYWFLLDPMNRILERAPLERGVELFRRIEALPPAEEHAGVPMHAPVLIVPRVFEPELCRRLIDLYDADGGEVSGTMRDVDGRTVPVVDSFKKRRDAQIADPGLKATIRSRLSSRLVPAIRQAYMFEATHIERYIVACYSADDGGYFKPHRDNTTQATAHRQFACSINLNAEEFEGGDLRFPEFGRRTYRPPTGGAVVFSCALLHEATPVTRGARYACLPFLYDAEHARIRDATRHLIGHASAGEAMAAA